MKTTHQIKKKHGNVFPFQKGEAPIHWPKERRRKLTAFENCDKDRDKKRKEKHPRSSPFSKRAPSPFRRGQHRSTPHALFHCQKLFPLEIYRPAENRSVISGQAKQRKAATLFSRAKDNWRPFFPLALLPPRFLSPEKGARLRELTIVKCTYGFR